MVRGSVQRKPPGTRQFFSLSAHSAEVTENIVLMQLFLSPGPSSPDSASRVSLLVVSPPHPVSRPEIGGGRSGGVAATLWVLAGSLWAHRPSRRLPSSPLAKMHLSAPGPHSVFILSFNTHLMSAYDGASPPANRTGLASALRELAVPVHP